MFIQASDGVDFMAIPERAFLEVSNFKVMMLQKFLVSLCLQGTLSLLNNFNSLIFFFQLLQYPQHLLQQVRLKVFVLFSVSPKLNLNLSILEFWANFSSKFEQ